MINPQLTYGKLKTGAILELMTFMFHVRYSPPELSSPPGNSIGFSITAFIRKTALIRKGALYKYPKPSYVFLAFFLKIFLFIIRVFYMLGFIG